MIKIGNFIYPWGNGHYTRMMRLTNSLSNFLKDEFEMHYFSRGEIYQKLLKNFPSINNCIHEILMPTPIEGKFGPSVSKSLFNVLLPYSKNPSLISQIANYLKKEAYFYDKENFSLVINDGDVGSNVLAKNREIPSIFVTNQFMPKMWKTRFYFYPAMIFIAKQIAKASTIIVADSPPPYTICEYNLNFSKELKEKVRYVGYFVNSKTAQLSGDTDLEKLVEGQNFGYWMRTGEKSTNEGTGKKYQEIFRSDFMRTEKRIISHAKNDKSIDNVAGNDGKNYSVSEALEKNIDWIQIDIGFLTEKEKHTILDSCKYAVVNGSHTVMGEVLGIHKKPIIGIPVYDEHTNNIEWAQQHHLGILAKNQKQVIEGIKRIKNNYEKYEGNISKFSQNFVRNGSENTAKIISEILDNKK